MNGDHPFHDLPMTELVRRSSFGAAEVRRKSDKTPPAVREDLLPRVTRVAGDTSEDLVAAPYFYLSHPFLADDPEVRRFFNLLCSYVMDWAADVADDERLAADAARPGYLAGDPSLGDRDDPRACRVFVPLLSAGYFRDPRCHEQWDRFHKGDDRRRQQHPFGLSAVVPVLWDVVADVEVPAWAATMPVVDTAPSHDYAERGIHALLVENDPATYRKVVFRLAGRIYRRAESLPLPPNRGIADEPV